MTLKKRRVLLGVCVLVFLAGAIAVNFYVLGFRLNSDFKIIKTGGIYIYSPESKSDIYLNSRLKEQTGIITNGVFIQNLNPQTYSVLVAKSGFWPWQKKIPVKEEMVSELKALLISQNPKGEIILKGPFLDLYSLPDKKILALVEKKSGSDIFKKLSFYSPKENIFLTPDSLATQSLAVFKDIEQQEQKDGVFSFSSEKGEIQISFDLNNETYKAEKIKKSASSPANEKYADFVSAESGNFNPLSAKLSSRKKELIWFDEQNNIRFDALKDEKTLPYFLFGEKNVKFPVLVFRSKFPITNIDFFPGRRDVIIAALSNGIYALELDRRGGQNLQPIYKGKNPDFAVFPGQKKVYILDDGNLISVEI